MKSRTAKILEIIIITLLSFAAGYGVSVHWGGDVWSSYTENYITPPGALNLLVFTLTFALLYFLLELLKRYKDKIGKWISTVKECEPSKNKFLLIVFAALIIFWLPYLLSFAPASVLGDSLNSIEQVLYHNYSNGMPIFYTLFIRLFMWVGNLLGSINRGLFAYACFQYLVLAFTCAATVTWLYTHKVKKIIVIIAALFYAVFPTFPAYAVVMWKDPIFSAGLAALSFILLHKKGTPCQLLVSVLIILSFRSNGLVIIAIMAAIMLLRRARRKQGLLLAGALLLFIIASELVLNRLDARRLGEEALGIPLQQISYTVVYEYDSLSEEEIESINKIIPVDVIREAYEPGLVDSIKWNEQFNSNYVRENSGEVLKLWLRLLPGHLGSYIRAYALDTFGFWTPFAQSDYGYTALYISENDYGIEGRDLFEEIFGTSIKEKLADFTPHIGSGTLVWIMLLGFALCLISGQFGKLWFYLPGVLCWLSVMISTPVAFSLRYVYILILLLPVYILMPFVELPRAEEIK